MAEDVVVDAPAGSTNDGATKSEPAGQQSTSTQSTQVTAPANAGWDKERTGLLNDLKKERQQRQQYEQSVAQAQAELAQERRRVQALAGVNPRSAEDTEVDAVRQRFGQLFPGLAKLSDGKIERLLAVAEQSDNLEAATTHHWETHGRTMLDSVTAEAAKVLGGTLTPRQAARLERAYVQEAEQNPEFLARHERGDRTLVAEFIKNWNEDWFEPARRRVTQSEVARQQRVPSGRDRSIASTGGKKLDYNDPKAVEQALVDSFRKHGGEFGE
jgi:hypothetical protein